MFTCEQCKMSCEEGGLTHRYQFMFLPDAVKHAVEVHFNRVENYLQYLIVTDRVKVDDFVKMTLFNVNAPKPEDTPA